MALRGLAPLERLALSCAAPEASAIGALEQMSLLPQMLVDVMTCVVFISCFGRLSRTSNYHGVLGPNYVGVHT